MPFPDKHYPQKTPKIVSEQRMIKTEHYRLNVKNLRRGRASSAKGKSNNSRFSQHGLFKTLTLAVPRDDCLSTPHLTPRLKHVRERAGQHWSVCVRERRVRNVNGVQNMGCTRVVEGFVPQALSSFEPHAGRRWPSRGLPLGSPQNWQCPSAYNASSTLSRCEHPSLNSITGRFDWLIDFAAASEHTNGPFLLFPL